MWIAVALEAIIQGKGDYNYLSGAPFKDIKQNYGQEYPRAYC